MIGKALADARSSRLGGSTTTAAGPIRRSAMPRPKNLPHLTRGMPPGEMTTSPTTGTISNQNSHTK
jgi:hypothetical protein